MKWLIDQKSFHLGRDTGIGRDSQLTRELGAPADTLGASNTLVEGLIVVTWQVYTNVPSSSTVGTGG